MKTYWFIFPLFFGLIILFQNFDQASTENSFSSAWTTQKKGAGLSGYQEVDPLAAGKPYSEIYAQQAAQKIKSLNANWYYTWGIDPLTKVDSTVEFIPMIWTVDDTGKWLPSEIFKRLREQVNANNKKFRRLLLYNEPNGGNQAHMTPEEGANFVVQNIETLKQLTNGVVSPAEAGSASKPEGNLPWISRFLSLIDLYGGGTVTKESISRLAYHSYPDPIHLGLVPTNADPNNPNDPFYKDPANVEKAAHRLAADFINRLHFAHRRYHLPIWITEFGVADWESKTEKITQGCLNTSIPAQKNRVSQSLVKLFLEKVLPELSERAYVARYAIFSNDDQFGEQLKSNAIFQKRLVTLPNGNQFCDSSKLTDIVGAFYANFTNSSLCQRGEYPLQDGRMQEWVNDQCGTPIGPGWNFNSEAKQYRRVLTPIEAGLFQSTDTCHRGRYFDRYDNRVKDWMTPACIPSVYQAPASEGWRLVTADEDHQHYLRPINYETEKVSMFIFSLPWKK